MLLNKRLDTKATLWRVVVVRFYWCLTTGSLTGSFLLIQNYSSKLFILEFRWFPVYTRRFNVDTTSHYVVRRRIKVETTSCVYRDASVSLGIVSKIVSKVLAKQK